MTSAEELLAQLVEEVPEHTHPVVDSNTYFEIDPVTRRITDPTMSEHIIMQYDHGSEVYTFCLPRYIDGHDMMLCNRVLVHFNNLNASTGVFNADVHEITDLRLDPNDTSKVICSWTIYRHATQLDGTLNFLVQYMCVENDEVTYEWHTDIYYGVTVKPGRNNGEGAVINYTNILEQWYARIFGTGESVVSDIEAATLEAQEKLQEESASQQSAIAAKGLETLSTIPTDYTDTYNMATEALRTKADAIVCEAEGEVITASDASDDYFRGLRTFGKSTQVSTNGYQLLNPVTASVNAMTLVDAETYTYRLNVNNSVYGEVRIVDTDTLDRIAQSIGKTLHFTFDGSYSSERMSNIIFWGEFSDGASYKEIASTPGVTDVSAVIPSEIINLTMVTLRFARQTTEYTDTTTTFSKVNAYIDGDGTWEPYTGGAPSPSPEYPQDVVNEGAEKGTIGHAVYGGNLVDIPDFTLEKPDTRTKRFLIEPMKAGTYYLHVDLKSSTDMIYLNCGILAGTSFAISGVRIHNGATKLVVPEPFDYIYFYISQNAQDGETASFSNVSLSTMSSISYEPYKEPQTLTHACPNGLPGIEVTDASLATYTDADGKMWVADEVDWERGVYVQRVKSLEFDGSTDQQLDIFVLDH